MVSQPNGDQYGDQLATVFPTWPRFSQPAHNCIDEVEFTGRSTEMRHFDNATARVHAIPWTMEYTDELEGVYGDGEETSYNG
ncbi:hypothetical protein N7539_004068 [Penicillium diatomitis]|uniref:Uncharacterized protein n=1 Tax=Penicillium diatomitis TaxID=2819901 RepID=A0A9X0BYA5_9EURO|nr:uncharacterized protein N7539_004068 [Penicillium diatomitis]KAJ5489178.1 hypothetical protein N7539_004068 [Penicillium diatomitis]